MTILKKLALVIAVAACAALPDSAAQAAGGGAVSVPNANSAPRERSPEELAKSAYNAGYRQIKKADGYLEDAERAKDEGKKQKALDKARGSYEKALGEFKTAVVQNPAMHEAWNYIGYAERHLGNYAAALPAYDRALQLNPSYGEAIEYRAEAYLGLNRLDDARKAYMDLFAMSRPLANQLLASMQKFVGKRRAAPNGLDAQALDSFAQWVNERSTIAQQTASLDTGATKIVWR